MNKFSRNQISPAFAQNYLTPMTIRQNLSQNNKPNGNNPELYANKQLQFNDEELQSSVKFKQLGSQISLTGQKNFDELQELNDDRAMEFGSENQHVDATMNHHIKIEQVSEDQINSI